MAKKKKQNLKEYSKRVLAAIIILWFIGAIYGMIFGIVQMIICPEVASISDLLVYIGAPMSCGVVGYLIKSALENKTKIQKNYDPHYGMEEITECKEDTEIVS
nr:MAG TPA: hypothetical protein [Caudoviricetes sp.]